LIQSNQRADCTNADSQRTAISRTLCTLALEKINDCKHRCRHPNFQQTAVSEAGGSDQS